MNNEIMCDVDMFSHNQRIYFPDGKQEWSTTNALPGTLLEFSKSTGISKIHLYGNDEYLRGIKNSIEVSSMINYDCMSIEVEIN